MSLFALPLDQDAGVADELVALSKLEATSNAIRLRIAGLAPDQLYRGSIEEPPIAELIANAVDRERAYQIAFERARAETDPHIENLPRAAAFMDRDFAEDLALFFDLRRRTLDTLRALSDREWDRKVTLPGGETVTLEQLGIRLQRNDAAMLRAISTMKRKYRPSSGVNALRDMGVAGKLGQNLAQ